MTKLVKVNKTDKILQRVRSLDSRIVMQTKYLRWSAFGTVLMFITLAGAFGWWWPAALMMTPAVVDRGARTKKHYTRLLQLKHQRAMTEDRLLHEVEE